MSYLKNLYKEMDIKLKYPLERMVLRKMRGRGGIKELIRIALPFVLSMLSFTVLGFVDRVFLSWYSIEAVAAAMPALSLTWLFFCIFTGTAGYINTFIAQYYGANDKRHVAKMFWQGVYFSLMAIVPFLLCLPLGRMLINYFHGSAGFVEQELIYFSILMQGGFLAILLQVPASFFSGLGKTHINMYATFIQVIVNLLFDYLLIFGNFGFPQMGMAGAALATVLAWASSVLFYFGLIFQKKYRLKFRIHKLYQFNKVLFVKLLKYGLPNGLSFFVGEMSFAFFNLIIGLLGTVAMAASNIVISIYLFAVLPVFGFGLATSVLIGQYIGRKKRKICDKIIFNVFMLTFIYVFFVLWMIFGLENVLLGVFNKTGLAEFEEITLIAKKLILLFPILLVGEIVYQIYANALNGAGDTKFKMWAIFVITFIFMSLEYVVIVMWGWPIMYIWLLAGLHYFVMGLVLYFRYKMGVWKTINIHGD
ncbi:MATE family efflux transporter [bacterium]|jgi:multidrug resistance protein, MATE family|nr:MATE family efflux transporter [bacterium]MBT3581925.1 MATE family efflux transporter [bacterium]MBT4551722.1 MATE family efflux transporter [bacterium]MBT7087400.1 MATE family efflux transporter [bacterium]